MDNLKKLPGFRDLEQGPRLDLNRAYTVLSDIFSSYGYDAIDTPFLEPTEMFLRKGGGEMASQIYSFVDPGGNPVSLRPEFTSSILRWCLEEDRLDMLPIRVQYGGPVFRYRRQGDEYRQFHQAGVELIGSADPRADAEALMLACQGLSALGVEDLKLVLGDLGVYNRLALQMSLSERARVFLLDNVSRLRGGADGLRAVGDRAAKFRLISDGRGRNGLMAQLVGLKEAEARSLIAGMIEREDPMPWDSGPPRKWQNDCCASPGAPASRARCNKPCRWPPAWRQSMARRNRPSLPRKTCSAPKALTSRPWSR